MIPAHARLLALAVSILTFCIGAQAATYANVQDAVTGLLKDHYFLSVMNTALHGKAFASSLGNSSYAHTVLIPTNQAIVRTLRTLNLDQDVFLSTPQLLSNAMLYMTLQDVVPLTGFWRNRYLPTLMTVKNKTNTYSYELRVDTGTLQVPAPLGLACSVLEQDPDSPCNPKDAGLLSTAGVIAGASIVYIIDRMLTPPGWPYGLNGQPTLRRSPSPPPPPAPNNQISSPPSVPVGKKRRPRPPPAPSPLSSPPVAGKKRPRPPPSPLGVPPPLPSLVGKKKRPRPPPTPPNAPAPPSPPPPAVLIRYKTIDAALRRQGLSLFSTALQLAGLLDDFTGLTVPATIFAPSDSAVTFAMEALKTTIAGLAASNSTLLKSILAECLVVGQALTTSSFVDGFQMYSYGGQVLTTHRSFDFQTVYVEGAINVATITTPDISAGSIEMHIIDSVLMPV